MNPAILALIIQEAPALIEDVVALFHKHPALTPDVLAELAPAVYSQNAATRSTVAADQASHPTA